MMQLGIATQVYVIKVKVTVTKNRNSVSAHVLQWATKAHDGHLVTFFYI